MPESDDQRESRRLRELEGKNVSHYSVMLSAWIETRMERDRTLVTLSAGAIGLIVTILTTAGASGIFPLVFVVLSLIGFGLCIWSSLIIYQLNAQHIEDEIRQKSDSEPNLEKFDKRSIRSFISGVLFLVLFGISSAVVILGKEDTSMASKANQKNLEGDSFTKSLSGIGGLAPEQPAQQSSDPQSDSAQANSSDGEDGSSSSNDDSSTNSSGDNG